MSRVFEHTHKGVRFVTYRCKIGGASPAWGACIYWPTRHETGKNFMAEAIGLKAANARAKQWAINAIEAEERDGGK
jgi:hypothetical protein